MTKDEYLQLVQASEAFKALDKFYQEKVLRAEGKDLEAYAAIFQKEAQRLFDAKKELFMNNEAVVKTFTGEVKVMKKEKLKSDEVYSTKKDQTAADDLLEELKNV